MQEKAVADKRKKLLRAIPSTIPGVSAVVKGDARGDIREIEGLVDMQVHTTYVRRCYTATRTRAEHPVDLSISVSVSVSVAVSPDARRLFCLIQLYDPVACCCGYGLF